MSARVKWLLLGGYILGAALALLAWSQPWFTVHVALSGGPVTVLEVRGQVASPALSAFAFAAFALALALALAGRRLRRALAVLGMLVGICVLLAVIRTIAAPDDAVAPAVTTATGIAGSAALHAIMTSAPMSGWPVVGVLAGAVLTAVGVGVLVTGTRWPDTGRKYDTQTRVPGNPGDAGETNPIAAWDALGRGADPTAAVADPGPSTLEEPPATRGAP